MAVTSGRDGDGNGGGGAPSLLRRLSIYGNRSKLQWRQRQIEVAVEVREEERAAMDNQEENQTIEAAEKRWVIWVKKYLSVRFRFQNL